MKNECDLCGRTDQLKKFSISTCLKCAEILLKKRNYFLEEYRRQHRDIDEFKLNYLVRHCLNENIEKPSVEFVMHLLGLSRMQAYKYRKFLLQELESLKTKKFRLRGEKYRSGKPM